MKNLQVSFNDLSGSRFNGHDLHLYLKNRGWDANQLVWEKLSDDQSTFEVGRNFKKRKLINIFFNSIQQDFLTYSTLYPFSYSLLFDEKFLETDVVHYHLIHNHFFNITHLPILTKLKPSVWTLHDPWALTGHCIHFFDCKRWKEGCGDCPNLDTEFSLRKDATAINWEIKRIAYQASNLDVIVASKWMYDIVRDSPLVNHFETHLIPFGIDQDVFKPMCKNQAKAFFKIPQGNKVIAFRAAAWKLKGLDYIKESLAGFENKEHITLLTSNQTGLIDDLAKSYHVVELGWIDDVEVLRNYYNAADVFLMPSEAESFGMSAVESMACGTPVIAFADTALADTIGAPVGGITVAKGSSAALGKSIQLLLSDDDRRRSLADGALKIARERYDLKRYLDNITGLYKHVIDKRAIDERSGYLLNQLQKTKYNETDTYTYHGSIVGSTLRTIITAKLKKYPLLFKPLRAVFRVFKGLKQILCG